MAPLAFPALISDGDSFGSQNNPDYNGRAEQGSDRINRKYIIAARELRDNIAKEHKYRPCYNHCRQQDPMVVGSYDQFRQMRNRQADKRYRAAKGSHTSRQNCG
jgi:hypothetical protein